MICAVTGSHGSGGPVRRSGRRQEAAQAARDHFRREVSQTQQRPNASPQNRKC